MKTKVKPSKIHGYGLFADENIAKGKVVWRFKKGLDLALSKKEFNRLPKITKDFCKRYTSLSPETGRYILGFDNDHFVNHSPNANTRNFPKIVDDKEVALIAVRKIRRGEEITNDYREIDKAGLKSLNY